jgi:hypothetical protein
MSRCAGRSLYWDARAPINRAAAQDLQAELDKLGAGVRSLMATLADTFRPVFVGLAETFGNLMATLADAGLLDLAPDEGDA